MAKADISRSTRTWLRRELPAWQAEGLIDERGAEELARRLTDLGLTVFYDANERAELWGKDLAMHLHDIYCKRSRFVAIIVSVHYVQKPWTIHELRAALSTSIALGMHHSKISLNLFFSAPPFLLANKNDGTVAEPGQTADDSVIIRKCAISMQFVEFVKNLVDIVQSVGTQGMAAQL